MLEKISKAHQLESMLITFFKEFMEMSSLNAFLEISLFKNCKINKFSVILTVFYKKSILDPFLF
jgi:hypothetical protein